MDLEYYRKDAKRLLRAFKDGDHEAQARADRVLGERARARFLLSDAQLVIAVERGYRSWPKLLRAIEVSSGSAPAATRSNRSETVVDTALEYRPGDPVLVRIARREQRVSISDDGAAIQRAGRPPGWRQAVDRLNDEFTVNVTRAGVVWLPLVPVGPSEQRIVQRIGKASLALYQEILDLPGYPSRRPPPAC